MPGKINYLVAYSEEIQRQVHLLISRNGLSKLLLSKYSGIHDIQTDKALYSYVIDLKTRFIRNAPFPSKVLFDSDIRLIRRALGTHTTVSRVQGGKLKAKNEIRIASLFKNMPLAFLQMIVVHELAHLKEKEHNKAFYALCLNMEPDYHQLEFDLRLYLTHMEQIGELDWKSPKP